MLVTTLVRDLVAEHTPGLGTISPVGSRASHYHRVDSLDKKPCSTSSSITRMS